MYQLSPNKLIFYQVKETERAIVQYLTHMHNKIELKSKN